MTTGKGWLAFLAVTVVGLSSAWADVIEQDDIDPPLLHIGSGVRSSCPTGHEFGCPTSPNSSLGARNFSVYFNSDGKAHKPLTVPVILIIGIPNYAGPAPRIGAVYYYPDFRPGSLGALVRASLIEFRGRLEPREDAYIESRYNHTANNSNSFTNWAGAVYERFGYTPAFFGLYSYRIDHTFTTRDLFDVSWDDAIPSGTFVIAYGCSSGHALNGECGKPRGKNTFTTPFTHSGMVVPEPASILMVGSVLLLLGWLKTSKRTGSKA